MPVILIQADDFDTLHETDPIAGSVNRQGTN